MSRISELISVLSKASDRYGNPYLTGFVKDYGLAGLYEATELQLTEYIEQHIGGMSMENVRFITPEQAADILPDGETIHTFLNAPFGLVGADWDRAKILEKINSSDKRELTGPGARGMGHGLAVYNDNAKQGDILFIETDEERLRALEAELDKADGAH